MVRSLRTRRYHSNSLSNSNLPVYNIKMAYAACQQDEIQSWSQWVQDNQCMNITESPPSDIPYTITMLTVPKWAYQDLSNGQFNLDAALTREHSFIPLLRLINSDTTEARTWSPIQIALPIIVGLIVALAALLLFLWYRRRHQGAFTGRRRSQKPWQSANLHAPRRFFGLVPQRFTVRSRGSPGPQWEIDENVVLGEDDDPAKAGDSRPGSRTSAHSHPHSHSRGASTASLLTTGSARSSQPRSILDVLASKLSSVSLAKRYQNGAAKGPDYKRVRVASAGAGQPFNIDQDMATPVAHTFDAPAPPRPRQDSVESAGLPSVLDIRAPSRAPSAAGSRALRDDSLPLSEAPTDLLPPSVFRSRSEFSLGTTDLMTPTSPSSLDQQGDIGSRVRPLFYIPGVWL